MRLILHQWKRLAPGAGLFALVFLCGWIGSRLGTRSVPEQMSVPSTQRCDSAQVRLRLQGQVAQASASGGNKIGDVTLPAIAPAVIESETIKIGPYLLTGTVVDANSGLPLMGAFVYVGISDVSSERSVSFPGGEASFPVFHGTTDASGRFYIRLPESHCGKQLLMEIEEEGYARYCLHLGSSWLDTTVMMISPITLANTDSEKCSRGACRNQSTERKIRKFLISSAATR